MALKTIFCIIFLLLSAEVFSQTELSLYVKEMFQDKQYEKVVKIFQKNQKHPAYYKDINVLAKTFYSLLKEKQYRPAVELQVRYLKLKFTKKHLDLTKKLKAGEEIDGDSISDKQKILYWKMLVSYSEIIKTHKKESELLEKDVKKFEQIRKILNALEFREGKVDKIQTSVQGHLQYLKDKVYSETTRMVLQYVSWQRNADIITSTRKIPLIVTNVGICAGAEYGWSNKFYHFFGDGCFLFGGGTVTAKAGASTYKQGGLGLQGAKLGLGAGKYVSSSQSEIGIKLPIMVVNQNIQAPPTSFTECSAGCSTSGNSSFLISTSLYGRFPVGRWTFDTEFGRFITQDNSLWSLGVSFSY